MCTGEEDYLEKQIEKEALMEKQKEFEEMDNLIEAGMEDVRTESHPSSRERIPLDSSMIAIDLNSPLAVPSSDAINDSFIRI